MSAAAVLGRQEEPVVRHVQVELENSSWIEGRGVRHTHWDVRVSDAWVPIDKLRSIPKIEADPDLWFSPEVDDRRVIPPGCQYRITFYPRLPIGTRVRKRVSLPRADKEWTVAQRQLPLKVTMIEYHVRGEYKLVTDAQLQREARERQRPRAPIGAPPSDAELAAFRAKVGLAPAAGQEPSSRK